MRLTNIILCSFMVFIYTEEVDNISIPNVNCLEKYEQFKMNILSSGSLFLCVERIENELGQLIPGNDFKNLNSRQKRAEAKMKFKCFQINEILVIPLFFTKSSHLFKLQINKKMFVLKRSYNINEGKYGSLFDHKNIVETYFTFKKGKCLYNGSSADIYWILLEYLDFEVKRNEKNMDTIYKVCQDVLEGLDYLHEKCFVHLDLKIKNIMGKSETKDGKKIVTYKLIDFGLTKNFNEDKTLQKNTYGTFFYYAPEIYNKMKYTKKSDIWSFGIFLYYDLLGHSLKYEEEKIEEYFNYVKIDIDEQCVEEEPEIKLLKLAERCTKMNPDERPYANMILTDILLQKPDLE